MSKQHELVQFSRGATGGGSKNLLINGGFQIFQRASAATTVSTGQYQTADRWRLYESTDGSYTTERSTDTPSGTGYSLKAVVTTADTSIAATQYASIEQYIEAQNCQHLAYGTSGAKALTLSFYVKSSKTGIYTITLYKPDTTGYIYTKEYTINAANTWEKKEITITPTAGSTSFITSSGGAIANDNGIGLALGFNLAWGSNFSGGTSDVWSATIANYSTTNAVNWMDTVGNTFLIAEAQLEVNDTSTDFEFENYATTLAKCQRYFYNFQPAGTVNSGGNEVGIVGSNYNGNNFFGSIYFPVTMRATPALSSGGDWASRDGNNNLLTSVFSYQRSSPRMVLVSATATNVTGGNALWVEPSSGTSPNTAFMDFDAEL